MVDPSALAPWCAYVTDPCGEHAVLSDGWHHLRIDIADGTLLRGPVVLHYSLHGVASAAPKVLPLRRLIDLSRRGRFLSTLYPPDRRVERWIATLRTFDAIRAGASQQEIARVFYGDDAVYADRGERADSLRSRVRRLATEARALARGSYRYLMVRRFGR